LQFEANGLLVEAHKLLLFLWKLYPVNFPHRRTSSAGFTFVEVVVGATILGLVASSVLWGLNQLNGYATSSRLYTAAQTLAQNQIDLILTKGPYDPSQSKYPLLDSTDSSTNILRTDKKYYSDPTTPTKLYTSARSVAIYTDPMTNNSIVTGTIATDVTPVTVTVNGVNITDLRRATVTVAYRFRRNNYNVVMETMRTSDR
jgi:type II secretory pathway pseudopilin PulG